MFARSQMYLEATHISVCGKARRDRRQTLQSAAFSLTLSRLPSGPPSVKREIGLPDAASIRKTVCRSTHRRAKAKAIKSKN